MRRKSHSAISASTPPLNGYHAKCVVVDGTSALVTSANFTPHAQLKNIELGVKLKSRELALRIEAQFEELVGKGTLLRLPGT